MNLTGIAGFGIGLASMVRSVRVIAMTLLMYCVGLYGNCRVPIWRLHLPSIRPARQ